MIEGTDTCSVGTCLSMRHRYVCGVDGLMQTIAKKSLVLKITHMTKSETNIATTADQKSRNWEGDWQKSWPGKNGRTPVIHFFSWRMLHVSERQE